MLPLHHKESHRYSIDCGGGNRIRELQGMSLLPEPPASPRQTAVYSSGEIRTLTALVLKQRPLPIGLRRRIVYAPDRIRTCDLDHRIVAFSFR